MANHEIVVLGGNMAGLGITHYLLKHSIPTLEKLSPSTKFHITIVTPSTHFFYKISAPRATTAKPDAKSAIPLDKIFLPLEDGFKDYPKESYRIIYGVAKETDKAGQNVVVAVNDGGAREAIHYDTLVIATGTTSASPLWTLHGSHKISVAAMEKLQSDLPEAKSIIVAGGGPAGVETAGEIADRYPSVDLTVLSGGERLLPRYTPATSRDTQHRLEKMGAKVVNSVKVTKSEQSAGGKSTTVHFDDGTSKTVDVYVDATGGVPNSDFVPGDWLDGRKRVLTDNNLRLTVPGVKGVYAVGDVGSYSYSGVWDVKAGVPVAASSIVIDVTKSLDENKVTKVAQKTYKWLPDSGFVPIGLSGGVGQIFGWRIPSFLVWLVKGRGYLISMAPGAAWGGDYSKP